VGPVHHCVLAARMRVEVVYLGRTAGRVRLVRTLFHLAVAADVIPVVVDGFSTATSVGVVGLRADDAAAADVRVVVIDVVAATTGVPAVFLRFQLPIATDVILSVVVFTVATSVRRMPVDVGPTTARIWAVKLRPDLFVWTAEMGAEVVRSPVAAARVVAR